MMGINAKLLEDKLKVGWTTEQFAEYLDVSKKEVIILIEKNFTSRAVREFKARLDKNDKRFQKNKENIEKRGQQRLKKEITKVPEKVIAQEPKTKKEPIKLEQLLQNLQKEEQQLCKELCNEELLHTNCIKRKREIKELLIMQRDKLQEIKKNLEESEKEAEKLISELNQVSEEMISINERVSEKRRVLEDMQKQIKSLEKVAIYVYNNGEIERENCELEIPDSWNKKYYKIIEMDFIDSLTMKQVKQLAKVISFTELLKEQMLEFDITFDSEELKAAYERAIMLLN